jgi:hypothetical protein
VEAKLGQLADRLSTNKNGLASLKLLQKDVDRLRTYLESLKNRSTEIADHLVWSGFAPYATVPRVAVVVTAQDVQITKDGTFTGKKLSALGSVEILYFVSVPMTGAVMASGALYETRALPKIDLTKSEKPRSVFAPVPAPPGNSAGRR